MVPAVIYYREVKDMSAKIFCCDNDSIAAQLGLDNGDTLISINGNEINDVIDYMFYSQNENIILCAECDGELVEFEIEKEVDEPLGINFETYLIDKQRSCKNKCIFCFIDQLPKGLRETLYFKDDDARLSFLMGNYITLTNLSDADIERICRMRISPINISVHTTNPELRVKMMSNPNAAKINDVLCRFADAGITMNCQIVLCRGVNDGEELKKSLADLKKLYPSVASVSVVPVGLTKFRDGLYPLEPFTSEECRDVIECINSIGNLCKQEYGVRLFYPSDEFFIKGGLELPDEDWYDGYPQIENGVGLSTSLLTEVKTAVKELTFTAKNRDIAIVTGVLSRKIIEQAIDIIKTKCPNINCTVYPIINNFFGEKITVSGLVTATDIIDQLKDKKLPKTILIPSSMLRAEQDMFLDSVTVEQVEEALNTKIVITYNDGYDFVQNIIGE